MKGLGCSAAMQAVDGHFQGAQHMEQGCRSHCCCGCCWLRPVESAGRQCSRHRDETGRHWRAVCLLLLVCILDSAAGATARPDRTIGFWPQHRAGGERHGSRSALFGSSARLQRRGRMSRKIGVLREIFNSDPVVRKPLWCVAKQYANPNSIQSGLDWACGKGGIDCKPIRPNGTCFIPNTLFNHASYAFNAYYQSHGFASSTCDFNGAATLTTEDPSTPGCPYKDSIQASNNTVYSSSMSMLQCNTHCVGAAVGSVLISSFLLLPS